MLSLKPSARSTSETIFHSKKVHSYIMQVINSQPFIENRRTYFWLQLDYSWFAINLWGCGRQCQPSAPTGPNNGTNNIFACVIPWTWPP